MCSSVMRSRDDKLNTADWLQTPHLHIEYSITGICFQDVFTTSDLIRYEDIDGAELLKDAGEKLKVLREKTLKAK